MAIGRTEIDDGAHDNENPCALNGCPDNRLVMHVLYCLNKYLWGQ